VNYTIAIVFLIWAVAFAFSIIQQVTRKWFVPPSGDGERQRRPSWVEIALYDFLFFNILPGLVVVYFYPFMPLTGLRFGVALGVTALLLGAIPVFIRIGLYRERPAGLIAYDMFFQAIKMLVCFGLVGMLYPP
jgi:hypothetical protein